jgi:hypothetical protein
MGSMIGTIVIPVMGIAITTFDTMSVSITVTAATLSMMACITFLLITAKDADGLIQNSPRESAKDVSSFYIGCRSCLSAFPTAFLQFSPFISTTPSLLFSLMT